MGSHKLNLNVCRSCGEKLQSNTEFSDLPIASVVKDGRTEYNNMLKERDSTQWCDIVRGFLFSDHACTISGEQVEIGLIKIKKRTLLRVLLTLCGMTYVHVLRSAEVPRHRFNKVEDDSRTKVTKTNSRKFPVSHHV